MTTALANSPEARKRAFYDRLAPHALAPLWEVMRGLVPLEPRSKAVAHAWNYDTVRPLLLESGSLLTAEEAERRVLVLENPSFPGQSRATSTLYAGVQLILPGETAPAHRHTAVAVRFVLESEGGYTAVAGERAAMQRGDFLITPSGSVHDHGHAGTGPAIWVDGLDVPIVNFFEAGFSELFGDKAQPIGKPIGDSQARYGSGLAPLAAPPPFGAASPIFNYPYERSRQALLAVAAAERPDPHIGHALRYTNPIDGGWATPTIATWLTYLPAGFATRPLRSTDGQVVVVAEGELTAEVGEAKFDLAENDILAIPGWTARRFHARAPTILFTFSDRAVQEKLFFWREARE